MKLLITGGSGFIGTHLIGELLTAGHMVTIFDKNMSLHFPELMCLGDVRDETSLAKAAMGKDAIIHLAAEHADNVRPASLYYEVNVDGARNVVAAAEKAGINRIVFTSSVAVYPLGGQMPDESSPPAPFNDYGKSKCAAEHVFTEWAKHERFRCLVTVRPCAIFGKMNRGNIYNLLRQIHSDRFIMVGRGYNKKSIGYVGNIVQFLIECLQFDPGSYLFNYADKPDLTTAELVEISSRVLGKNRIRFRIPYGIGLLAGYAFDLAARITRKKYPISAIRIRKFCANTTVSAERLLRTGFTPPVSLAQALERTIQAEFLTDEPAAGLYIASQRLLADYPETVVSTKPDSEGELVAGKSIPRR